MKLGIGELRGAIDGHKPVQLAVFRLHFGNVEVSLYGKNLLSDYKVIQHVLINSLESGYTLRPLTVGIKVIVRLGEPRP